MGSREIENIFAANKNGFSSLENLLLIYVKNVYKNKYGIIINRRVKVRTSEKLRFSKLRNRRILKNAGDSANESKATPVNVRMIKITREKLETAFEFNFLRGFLKYIFLFSISKTEIFPKRLAKTERNSNFSKCFFPNIITSQI